MHFPTDVYLWSPLAETGSVQQSLEQLEGAGLLSGPLSELRKTGYANNYSLAQNESLLSLTSRVVGPLLKTCPAPQAFVFHHSYAESAISRAEDDGKDFMSRARYFAADVLVEHKIDGVPFFGSFSTGCTGLFSMTLAALPAVMQDPERPVICVTSDIRPTGRSFDAVKEKILTSDCSGGFIIGRQSYGYKVLGMATYSTPRKVMPLVEVVKRTVQMARSLTDKLSIDLATSSPIVHYPNIFPNAWSMVANYLGNPPDRQVFNHFADRAHCLSSDSIFTLKEGHHGQFGRIHIVINFGSGLHLGVAILREDEKLGPTL